MSEVEARSDAVFRPLVAFDFDGTLTCRDSFMAYLQWRAGPVRYLAGLGSLAPDGITWMRDRDRARLKTALIRRFLMGVGRSELEASSRAFAAAASARLFRPDALKCWREWRRRHARLVIVTASPEIIVAPFAHGLGADRLIGTRLAFDDADRLTGALDGENCRAAEKVARLKAAFGEDVRLEAAYGDSAGDIDMLALADEAGMKVFGGRP